MNDVIELGELPISDLPFAETKCIDAEKNHVEFFPLWIDIFHCFVDVCRKAFADGHDAVLAENLGVKHVDEFVASWNVYKVFVSNETKIWISI